MQEITSATLRNRY